MTWQLNNNIIKDSMFLSFNVLSMKHPDPCGTVVKNLFVNAGDSRDSGSNPGLGRSTTEENGNPLQYYCLENSMDREPGGLQCMGSQRVGHN